MLSLPHGNRVCIQPEAAHQPRHCCCEPVTGVMLADGWVRQQLHERQQLTDGDTANKNKWNDHRQYRDRAGDGRTERDAAGLRHQALMQRITDDGEYGCPRQHVQERTQHCGGQHQHQSSDA
jgi:hypothetical protein